MVCVMQSVIVDLQYKCGTLDFNTRNCRMPFYAIVTTSSSHAHDMRMAFGPVDVKTLDFWTELSRGQERGVHGLMPVFFDFFLQVLIRHA